MTTDRELLELAAKAYWGDEIDDVVSVEYSESDEAILYTHGDNQDHNGCDQTLVWNPLQDDGDAFRMAVKLNMSAIFSKSMQTFNGEVELCIGTDPYSATRRAIVRAAAEIGRMM